MERMERLLPEPPAAIFSNRANANFVGVATIGAPLRRTLNIKTSKSFSSARLRFLSLQRRELNMEDRKFTVLQVAFSVNALQRIPDIMPLDKMPHENYTVGKNVTKTKTTADKMPLSYFA